MLIMRGDHSFVKWLAKKQLMTIKKHYLLAWDWHWQQQGFQGLWFTLENNLYNLKKEDQVFVNRPVQSSKFILTGKKVIFLYKKTDREILTYCSTTYLRHHAILMISQPHYISLWNSVYDTMESLSKVFFWTTKGFYTTTHWKLPKDDEINMRQYHLNKHRQDILAM